MSQITVGDIPLDQDGPAQRLRRTATACRIGFTWMGVRKTLNKDQKQEAADPFGAAGESLSAGKKLVDTKDETFKALTQLKGQIGDHWKSMTLPYVEAGVRLIKHSDVSPFHAKMSEYKQELAHAAGQLQDRMYSIKANARERLGRLFDEHDYPTDVTGLFSVEWDFPNTEPPAYLMQLNPDIYRQEQARIAARFDEAIKMAEQSFAVELQSMVQHLQECLKPNPDGGKKVFRNSAIENVHDFIARFRHLSMGSNADLDRVVDQAERLVSGLDPQDLRETALLRERIKAGMAEVGQQLAGMVQAQPRRAITREAAAS
jgi:hypothetical protein